LGEKNREAGERFLAKNKQIEGITTTKSGLQYSVLREGDGVRPERTDSVRVHFRGFLLDGTEFANTYKKNRPQTFAVGNAIAGWSEALQLMRVGGKYRFHFPPELAYGRKGRGRLVGPYSTLIFEAELQGIESREEDRPPATEEERRRARGEESSKNHQQRNAEKK
jgi:FKBP-type peptidyl-prolyl cis-trans isomerase